MVRGKTVIYGEALIAEKGLGEYLARARSPAIPGAPEL
jgi:hypothetical protein